MAKKVKDTEYLMLSSMIRAREAGMLTRERMDRYALRAQLPGSGQAAV